MVAKPAITPRVVPSKTHPIGKKTVQFPVNPIINNLAKTVTLVWNFTPVVATTDAQDEDETAIWADDGEVIF